MNRKQRRATGKAAGGAPVVSTTDAEFRRLFNQAMDYHRAGSLDLAIEAYRRALARDPSVSIVYNNMGSALKDSGHLAEAVAAYEKAISLEAKYPTALSNLSCALSELERYPEAEERARQALSLTPRDAMTLANLAQALCGQHKLQEALTICRKGLAIDPRLPSLHHSMGHALLEMGEDKKAMEAFGRVLALTPDSPILHNNIGALLLNRGKAEEAFAYCRRALELDETLLSAWRNLGLILRTLNRLEESAEAFRRGLKLDPMAPLLHSSLGVVLQDLGRAEEAFAECRHAVELAPNHIETLCNLGTLLFDANRLEEAEVYWGRAAQLRPDLPTLRNNMALLLLKRGDYANGWREYEWRWAVRGISTMPSDRPEWRGEDISGKTILFYAEQGFGDAIQFLRFLPLIAQRGARVLVAVHGGLVRLASSIPGVAQAMKLDDNFPYFDTHLPLMSIPRVLGTLLDTIPNQVPYLHPDPADVDRFAALLAEKTAGHAGLKVGLVWAGSPGKTGQATTNVHRNLDDHLLDRLLDVPGVTFVALQMGADDTIAALPPSLRPISLMDQVGDFGDTAALVQSLDLVISVDTAVAHLAGALGKPVWLMQRYNCDWRWLTERDDSPWYPTLRQIRQPHLAEWGAVVDRVVADLKLLAAGDGGETSPAPSAASLTPFVTEEVSDMSPRQLELIKAARTAIQSAVSQSELAMAYLSGPFDESATTPNYLKTFLQGRPGCTVLEFAAGQAWADAARQALQSGQRIDLLVVPGLDQANAVQALTEQAHPGLYRLFTADGLVGACRKDSLFDYCSAVFVETGMPTVFAPFLKDVVKG